MGQKLATDTSQWTVNDWAFGTASNAVPLEEVVEEAKQVPMKYFGGQAIQNDTSMQQMQQDLLSFDDTVKRLFFWRKKNKRSKKTKYSDQGYYAEKEQYIDGIQQAIPEEDESTLPPIYAKQTIQKDSSWQCQNCSTKNRSSDVECRQCKANEARF